MSESTHATNDLFTLKDVGFRLAIDDFGTGYSSLSYLQRFPIDVLKIDRGFIMDMTQNASNAQLVRTIITMGHNLGLEVIAEGVETLAQKEQLKNAGCDLAQGYLLGRPMSPEQITELLKGDHPKRRSGNRSDV
jgi:EAL domain-containing protein (putative c-di-GMP-specific phosphodiesterase class I)